jgi:hypothetical protein
MDFDGLRMPESAKHRLLLGAAKPDSKGGIDTLL